MTGPRRNQRVVTEEAWMEHAACKGMDPDLWFPKKGPGSAGLDAKRVCAVCTVRQSCLQFALDNGFRDGIFGGVSMSGFRRGRRVA